MEKTIYNIIGDIHGRTNWKNLTKEGAINVFLGDYFDPYVQLSGNKELSNFKEVIDFKDEHPETILLLGNHDIQYLYGEKYSRYNYYFANRFKQALLDNLDKFVLAANIGEKVLFTHAGVTRPWLEMVGLLKHEAPMPKPSEVVQMLNDLLHPDCKDLWYFTALYSFEPGDFCGESATASPVWVRPEALLENNVFGTEEIYQVVGHTQNDEIRQFDNVVFIDCLGQKTPASLLLTFDETGEPLFAVNQLSDDAVDTAQTCKKSSHSSK